MNQKCGVSHLREACRRNTLNLTLEKYIDFCRAPDGTSPDGTEGEAGKRRGRRSDGKFPNVAGFCRYLGIGIDDLDGLAREYPEQISMLYASFEDEALNSGLPPAVLSAYLKKRLGYDKDASPNGAGEGQMTIRFEHDIFSDGE